MIRPDCPIRPSCPIPFTRYRAPLVKHYGLTDDEIAIVEGKNETNQEPQGKTVGRPFASPRKRRQVTTSALSEPTDDKVRELMNM
jgi:hypothetical protein